MDPERQNKPKQVDEVTDSQGAKGSAPAIGEDLRLNQQVSGALQSVPGGRALDDYFGISSGKPQQSEEEAAKGARLMAELGELASEGGDPGNLFNKIADFTNGSGASADALRDLMRLPKSKPEDTQD